MCSDELPERYDLENRQSMFIASIIRPTILFNGVATVAFSRRRASIDAWLVPEGPATS